MKTSHSKIFFRILSLVLLAACCGTSEAQITGSSTVDWNNVFQRIDGFGASSAWESSLSASAEALLFSTNNNITYITGTNPNATTNICNGVGLSLLRSHIEYGNNTSASTVLTSSEISIMQAAQSYGARVWSTPWTPAAGFKSTSDIYDSETATAGGIDGGSYLGSGNNITNINYASQLANYVVNMKDNYHINLYAISVQNEPDAEVNSYEACQWSGAQIRDFSTNLYNALTNAGVGTTQIILPESQNWADYHGLAATVMGNPVAAADVGIIADHNYDGSYGPTSLVKNSYGKALWETEVSLLTGSDSSITNGVYYGQRIYQFMTQAQANAYHYWWLVSGNSTGNQGLLDNNALITKRLFAFGQYSRFVRPNFYRINATSSTASALVSAYKDSQSPAFAIVVVNTNVASAVTNTFNMTNFIATTVTPWVTSASLSLAPQTPVTITNGSFTYDIPALSIVTFVGQGITSAVPVFASVANQTVSVGSTLLVTNTATAIDVPPYSLTYSPANPLPANATLNSTTGVFSWTPSAGQANTTNVIEVAATDNDSGNLSATNTYTVIVNPLAVTPVFNSVPNLTVNAGVTVLVTNTATASDVPPYSLTYSAADTFPANATLDSTSGVFSWRPSVSQANTTNIIEVEATDNDPGDLSATNTFSVIINALTNPVVGPGGGSASSSYAQGQFNMGINGPQGPDYTVLMSTNLVNWQAIFTTDSPAMPFTFTDTSATNANQYYEIQIGP